MRPPLALDKMSNEGRRIVVVCLQETAHSNLETRCFLFAVAAQIQVVRHLLQKMLLESIMAL